jgi:oligosaccharide repeat unit polymerase
MKLLIIFTFLIIGYISFKNIFFKDHRVYSINKFLWLYVLIFWSIIPLFQYLTGTYPWQINITDGNALKANLFVLLWIIVYAWLYRKLSNKNSKNNSIEFPIQKFRISYLGIYLLLTLQFLILLFFFTRAGGFVFLRGDATGNIGDSQAIRLIVDRVFRSFTTFAAILILLNHKNKKVPGSGLFLLISLAFLLLTNFPLATARFMAGAFYIGLFFVIKPHFNNKALPYIGLLALFLIVYPATSYVRYLVTLSAYQFDLWNPTFFLSGDFDNYSTLNMTIQYVERNGITFGRQLLGVLFFFVPRSIWPDKPIGSGHLIANSRNWDFTNISCPIVAEGYINFGIFGIIIFALLLGYIVAKLDSKFYQYGKLNVLKIFYPLSLGMIFFLLRGDLMSSFAYTIGFLFSAFLIIIIITPFIKNINA